MTDMDVRLSPAAAVRLVASWEIGVRLRSKAYRLSTLAMLVLIVGGVFVAKLIGSSGGTTVGVIGPTAPLAAPLQASAQAIGEKTGDQPGRGRGRRPRAARRSQTARSTRSSSATRRSCASW